MCLQVKEHCEATFEKVLSKPKENRHWDNTTASLVVLKKNLPFLLYGYDVDGVGRREWEKEIKNLEN